MTNVFFTILNNVAETECFISDDTFFQILEYVVFETTIILLQDNMLSYIVSISIIFCYLKHIILLQRSYREVCV